MACVAVNSLITTLELEFLQPHPRPILQQMELIPFNKDLIQSLHAKLGFLIQLFDESRTDGVEAINHLETKLRDVASRVEDEIELHVVHLYEELEAFTLDLYLVDPFTEGDTDEAKKTQHSHRLSHVLQQAIEDIDAIKEDLEKVMMEYKHDIAAQGRKITLDLIPKSDDELVKMDGSGSSNHASYTEDIMVGKNNEFEIIRKMLIQHPSKQREVVSIQGMGGIGKTTLARRVYENPSIVSHFDRRLWVVVSQHHNKRQMLLGLLGSKDNVNHSSDGDLALQLYQSLKGQRYLVVMDDVWSRESWNGVNSCFPDDINGSRVLLTTRVAEVATCIGSNKYFSHQMHLLDQSESWKLFHKKTCKCHGVEFETIGRPIVEKCKGLPLAILVVAGVFPEDYKINANNLARLWAGEGLVKAFKNESFEVVAKRYINELMDRNLILVSKRSSCGRKIKEFSVHDLLHAFCVREGQNQSLLNVFHESHSNFPQKGARWLRIQRVSFEAIGMSALHSLSKHCRSIFYFPERNKHYSINLEFFNLLRVLYVTDLFHLPSPTVHIHLRYLRISWALDPYDSLFFKAWNLQTYSVYGNIKLHDLEFPQLQYIHCEQIIDRSFPKSVHQNLQVISSLHASQCGQESLTKVPYLKKVSIIILRPNDRIKNLVCLQQLESLSLYLKHWEAGADNFPKLERLFLKECSELREIPNSFAEIPTLNLIQLEECHPSAVMSAKQIEAEQHDYGNENMVVIEKNTEQKRTANNTH
ncbi:PREDICTED: putative late blight resistance protein homolog R1A-4 isoform X2 [Ipomoea nil]|uniref:putative late blight resistance protein homolog R1A-4 isoform X2 n=1 Tax=Ipomoea nil TaxID=35883 RepID=UPI000900996B|nr:PREDICTED: putative late blight resistance protein homolog R1A-4 isoform X2 [Ipomoea nil]